MDTTLGEKALGKDKTISGKVQETLTQAHAHARGIDEQKGISKQAHDVSTICLCSLCSAFDGNHTVLLPRSFLAMGTEGLPVLYHDRKAGS